ncbi:MAG: zf-TFIIB domain-containing protein [Luteolibacter sp.]
MQCPIDSSFLKAQGKGNLKIDFCEKCGGFFVCLGQAEALQLEKLLRKGLEAKGGEAVAQTMVSPSSGLPMKGFEFRGVHLDYCVESHSIWFDRGEYQKIFSAPGKGKGRPWNGGSESSVWDHAVTASDVGDGLEGATDVLGSVGDFLGDLLSGIDLF